MTFSELMLKLASDPGRTEDISAEEIIRALKQEFPSASRTGPAPLVGESIAPPADLPGIEWKGGAYHPTSVQQVREIVYWARGHGRHVRTAGARHSVPESVYSTDKHDVRVVLDGDLRRVTFLEKTPQYGIVQAGAGCYLGVNPQDHSSTPETSFNRIIDAQGYALPILGGISHQSIAGFLQTSSSGGSLCHGMADTLVEIELVTGTGDVVVVRSGSDEFNAAAVSMGLFGVITHATFKVEPRYFVSGNEENRPVEDSLLTKEDGRYRLSDALATTDYLHLNWFPQLHVKRTTEWRGSRGPVLDPGKPYKSELKGPLLNALAALVLLITSAASSIDPERAAVLVGDLLRLFVQLDGPKDFNYYWYQTLPCDDQVEVDSLIKIIFTEIWLPLDQLTEAVDRLNVLFKDQAVAGNFAVELYGAKKSPFWLSPAFDRDVVRVDVFWWAYSFGKPRDHFAHFWKALLELPGARLHWGKHLPDVGEMYGSVHFDVNFLRDRYEKLDDWMTMRHRMDPQRVFLSPYWQQIFGL